MPCKKILTFAELQNKNLIVLGEDDDIEKIGYDIPWQSYESVAKHKYFATVDEIVNDPDFEVIEEDSVVMKKGDI